MAVSPTLKHAVRRFLAALTEYAGEQNWNPGEYQIYYWVNAEWDRIHILFIADGFSNMGEFESYASVRKYLQDRLGDEPELMNYLSLVVRSRKQIDEAGHHDISPVYREYRPLTHR
jgi:hypothetical protein